MDPMGMGILFHLWWIDLLIRLTFSSDLHVEFQHDISMVIHALSMEQSDKKVKTKS